MRTDPGLPPGSSSCTMTGAVDAHSVLALAAAGAGRPSPIAQPGDQTILRSDPVFPALDAAISMKTDDLREAYLEYFASRGCVRRPSDVLVPNDPTVLFTPAGMNQFKREFMGLGEPGFKRATTCQKCIRTGDIENVGKTPRHMTFFEMLGNFSFGDYFKREAIHWAWEFLTRVLKIAPDRLTFTVYLEDDEAFDIWHKEVGVAANQITRMGEDDNFWPAGAPTHGPNGVCGPCSEIFYHGDGVEEVEIWNLVFTQFNRVGPGQLEPLPNEEHRYRHGPGTDRGGPAGRAVELRDRHLQTHRRRHGRGAGGQLQRKEPGHARRRPHPPGQRSCPRPDLLHP